MGLEPVVFWELQNIRHALFDRDEGVGRGEDGLETKTVPPHYDAYDALLVGNEQHHRDAMLEEQNITQENSKKERCCHKTEWAGFSRVAHARATCAIQQRRQSAGKTKQNNERCRQNAT